MRATVIRRLSHEEWVPLALWMGELPLEPITKSNYVENRLEKWLRVGSNLQSIPANRHRVFRCPEPPDFVTVLGDSALPGWESLLVCGGATSITRHSDHGVFESQAVMLNVGQARFTEHYAGDREESLALESGDLILLDIKVPHSSVQLSPARFHMTFRRIKKPFLAML